MLESNYFANKGKKIQPMFKNGLYKVFTGCCYYDVTINVFGSKLFGKWKYPLLGTVKQQSTCVRDQIYKFYGLLKRRGESEASRNITFASCKKSVQLNKQLVMNYSLCLTVGFFE